MKKIISIDLDGVLNTYSGEYSPEEIPTLKDGAKEFLEKLHNRFKIEIFTVRNKILVKKWLIDNNIIEYIFNITDKKNPFTSIFIDDRAINFDGNFDKTYNKISKFEPYWKK